MTYPGLYGLQGNDLSELQSKFKKLGYSVKPGFFGKLARKTLDDMTMARQKGDLKNTGMWSSDPLFSTTIVGCNMEDINTELNVLNQEIEKSKEILQKLSNEIKAVADVIRPELANRINAIRDMRMAIVTEAKESLNSLHEIRKFFLESDYKMEIERIERFLNICNQIKSLREDGLFDDICDSIVRMALKEEKKDGRK